MRIFTKVIAVLIFTLNLAFADEYEEGHAIALSLIHISEPTRPY